MSNIDKQTLADDESVKTYYIHPAAFGSVKTYYIHPAAFGSTKNPGYGHVPVVHADDFEKLRAKLEAAEKQIAEMSESNRLLCADSMIKQERIAEMEAREVTLPAQKYCPGEYAGSVLWGETEVWNQAISECAKAIRAAGIGKGE